MADLDQQESPIGGLGGAQVAVSPKGTVAAKGATNLSEESTKTILQNMQDLINQRTSPMSQFLGGLKDATAWTAGGVNGPTEALAAREAQKDKQDEQVMNMRSQMATLQSNAQQNANIRAQLQAMAGVGGGAGGTGMTGGAGGAGGMGYGGMSPSLVNPEVWREVLRMSQTDPQAAMKYYEENLKEASKINMGADMYKPTINVQKWDPNTNSFVADTVSPLQYKQGLASGYYRDINGTVVGGYGTQPGIKPPADTGSYLNKTATIESGNNPNAQSPTSSAAGLYGITKGTFETIQAQDPSLKNVTWEQFKANPELQTTAAQTLYNLNGKKLQEAGLDQSDLNHRIVWFTGNTKLATAPADAPITSVMSQKEIEANPQIQGKTVGQVRDLLNQQLQKASNVNAQAARATPSAPGMPTPNVSGQAAQNQLAVQQEQAKQNIVSNAEANKKSQQSFEDSTDRQKIAEQGRLVKQFDSTLKRIESNPDQQVVGLYMKPGVTSAIGTALSKGIQTPVGGISADIEDAMQKMGPGTTKQDIEDRAMIKQILQNFSFEVAQSATGQGSISDNERKMFQDMIGSASNTPEMLRKTQQYLQARNEYKKQIRDMYDDKVARGENVNFGQFKASKEYRDAADNYFNKLEKLAEGPNKGIVKPAQGTPAAAPKWNHSDADYEAWKKSKGLK